MSLKSLWKSLTWPDPALTAIPVTRESIVSGMLGRVKLDASLQFSYPQLVRMWGDESYSCLTIRGARILEDWARERYIVRPKWSEKMDCEKQRSFGSAEIALAWNELYGCQFSLPARGRIAFTKPNGKGHDCGFYWLRDSEPMLVEDSTGDFVPWNPQSVAWYFGGP